jgi:hypothetical protein
VEEEKSKLEKEGLTCVFLQPSQILMHTLSLYLDDTAMDLEKKVQGRRLAHLCREKELKAWQKD